MTDQPTSGRSYAASHRWGGALLAVGALSYAIAVLAFVLAYGQPEGSGPEGVVTLADRAAHYGIRQQVAHALWTFETLAALAIAVASLILLSRPSSARARVPGRAAWATIAIGALLLSTMYPIMLGGYPAATAGEHLALFGILNDIATFIFNMGSAIVFLGLAGAFSSEAAPDGVIAREVALAGVGVSLLGVVAAVGMLMGVGAMAAAAPVGLIGFILAAHLGFAIWRRG